METTINQVEFTRVNSDVNGNPRYVCHFLNFIKDGEFDNLGTVNKDGSVMTANDVIQYIHGMSKISYEYKIALKRARELGGKKFHNKQYGGGIVFQMYAGQQQEMSKRILEIRDRK